MKKTLAIILTLCMVLTLLPGLALAVETTTVANEAALREAITNAAVGDTIKLTANITIASQLNIDKAITLDGNGKTLTRTPNENTSDAAAIKAGVLVTANATIKNLTVSGPNKTASVWDNGEFGIKVFGNSDTDVTLDNVTVTAANAGIQVNGADVTMTGTIDVSGNEWGGIELCKGGTLNLTKATLKNDNETEDVPVLWNDDTKGTITSNTAQTLYVKKVDANKDHYYLSGNAKIADTGYYKLAEALTKIENSETLTLARDTTITGTIPIDKPFTLDLNGKTLTCNPDAGTTAINIGGTSAATVTLKSSVPGGKITCSTLSDGYNLVAVRAGSTLNFESGTIELIKSDTTSSKAIQNQGTLTVTGGKIVANNSIGIASYGGEVNFSNATITAADGTGIASYSSAAVTVSSGSITAKDGIFTLINTTVNFKGGSINATNAGILGHGTAGNGGTTINVSGGTITSTSSGIYHPQSGTLNISGTASVSGYENGVAIKSGNLNISGGTVSCTGPNTAPTAGYSNGINSSGAALQIESNSDYSGSVDVNITGGTVTSANGYSIYEYIGKGDATAVTDFDIIDGHFKGGIMISSQLAASETGKPVISGGYFTADPTAYIVTPAEQTISNIALPSDTTGYNFKVGQPAINVKVATAEAKAAAELPAGAPTPKVDAAEDVVEALAPASSDSPVKAEGLEAPAGSVAATLPVGYVDADKVEKLNTAIGGSSSVDTDDIKVYVQPYLDIKVKDVELGDESAITEITLDIKPMAKTVISTAESANAIVEPGADAVGVNAVQVGAAKEIEVTTPVTISIPLPANFTTADTMQIKHVKENGDIYYYTAAITGNTGNRVATFTVTHGFSEFTLMAADERTLTVDFDETEIDSKTYRITDVGSGFPTATKTGSTFNGWKFTDEAGDAIDGVSGTYKTLTSDLWTAIMGEAVGTKSVKALAQFSANPPSGDETFTLTFDANGGSAVAAVTKAKGSVIDLSGYTTAKDKYAFVGWYSDAALTTLVTSVTLNADTTVYAKWVEKPATVSFTDVKDSDWFYDDVAYAFAEGLMNGVSKTEFDPHGTTTRGMIVTMLYRLAGEPNVVAANPFEDVADGMYYTKPVIWAAANKIVDGYSAEKFGPEDPITREQMAKILYTYAKFKGQGVSQAADLSKFTDSGKINSWALDAMKWAVAMKLVQGDGTTLNPGGYAERCQVAAIFHRFCK